MPVSRLLCALAVAGALGLPRIVDAYCIGWDSSLPNYDPEYYSVAHEFARAKYVVTGRVLKETWLGEDGKPKPLQPPFQDGRLRPWGFDPYSGALYNIRIIHVFKGKPSNRLQLFSENSTARFWLDVGSEYLFFVTDEEFDKPIGSRLTIDTCGNSATMAKAGPTIQAISPLPKPK